MYPSTSRARPLSLALCRSTFPANSGLQCQSSGKVRLQGTGQKMQMFGQVKGSGDILDPHSEFVVGPLALGGALRVAA